ncbi:hypothetical protein B484DRAFT_426751 [Ochromonadaceae sp. CCMP2298]|nr:hypothetical protein B484DRAFT_327933 [Ochromonadaceae sp. CCMP2298]KAJ1442683.1 hypothetical protein B484DRAFT_426751 [Ochromonadaceae sp. CCMP2298]
MALVLALAVLLPLPSLSLPLPFHASRSRAKQLPKAPPSANPLRLLATTTPEDSSDSPPLQDFSTAAAGIFNSYRIPSLAAAAAAYGGVYALPLSASDQLVQQMAKRSYLLLGLFTTAQHLICALLATMAIDKFSLNTAALTPTPDLQSFLRANAELEWVALRASFLLGLLGFALMLGMRSWVWMLCPVFGKAGLGLIAASVCLMWALVDECLGEGATVSSLLTRYAQLLGARVLAGRGRYILCALAGLGVAGYTGWAYVHVYKYLLGKGVAALGKV